MALITIGLPYALPGLDACRVPEERLSAVYRMPDSPPYPKLEEEIDEALQRPIGAPALEEIARGRKRVAVLVDDLTRPTPAQAILIPVLEALAADDYRVLNSRFEDSGHLLHIGDSEDGVPIFIEEEVARADLKIGIGSIVPHGATGWSGGGKIIYPGVAGEETVMRFHFTHGLTEENMTGREDCPVRLRMEKWVDIVGLDFIVNSVLTPDNRVYGVVAGHYHHAQRRGVELAKKVYLQRIRERVDILLSVSYTHDLDFWQAASGSAGMTTAPFSLRSWKAAGSRRRTPSPWRRRR